MMVKILAATKVESSMTITDIDTKQHQRQSVLLIAIIAMTVIMSSLSQAAFATEKQYILTAQEWNIPRTASSILAMPALQAAMQAFQSSKHSRMVIKYPGGDEGTLWAHELRGWLISLGVASRHIELIPGSAKSDQLEISVITPK